MHTKPMKESEGTFEAPQLVPSLSCWKCKNTNCVTCRVWESNCGGYEDLKFQCSFCGHVWWVEGADS